MDSLVFNFCKENYKDEEVVSAKYIELYSVVKYTMNKCGITDDATYANLAVFSIIHAYLNGEITNFDKFCADLVNNMFEMTR